MATAGRDFFGRCVVLVGNKCIGVYPTIEEAVKAAKEYNNKNF